MREQEDSMKQTQVDGASTQQDAGWLDVQLVEVWNVVCRRWKWLAAGSALGLAGAVLYCVYATPIFESSAELMVEFKNANVAIASNQNASQDATVDEKIMADQLAHVQSRVAVKESMEAAALTELPSIVAELDDDQTVVDYVLENLYVTRGGEGQARDARKLNVSFRHTNPEDCQKVLEAIVARYLAKVNEGFKDVHKQAATLITQAREDIGKELDNAELAYREFRENAPILWTGESGANTYKQQYDQFQLQLTQVDMQIGEAESRLAEVQTALKEMDEKGSTDLEKLALIDDANATRIGLLVSVQRGDAESASFQARQPERMEVARSEAESLLALQLKETTLMQDFGPEHPEVVNVRKQITAAKDFLADKNSNLTVEDNSALLQPRALLDAYVNLLKRDLASKNREKLQLVKQSKDAEENAKSLAKYEMEGEALQKKVSRQQELYETVVDRLRDLQMAEDYGGISNSTLREPELGEEIWPSVPVCLALGLMAGGLFGGAMATVVELRDGSFRSSEDVKKAYGVVTVRGIPDIQPLKGKIAGGIDATVVAHHTPASRDAEVFRAVRTSLIMSRKNRAKKVLAVTSPRQGDGKTTLCANLAAVLSQSGKSVLLVDADMRRPRVAQVFGIVEEKGLAETLADQVEPWDVAVSPGIDNLTVMTAGQPEANPAEMLSDPRFEQFLQTAKEKFDFVIVDCPPMLPVTDPAVIASKCDGVIVVTRLRSDNRAEAAAARELLEVVGANIVGVVLNGCDPGAGLYAYGAYGGYYGPSESDRLQTRGAGKAMASVGAAPSDRNA